MGSFWRDLRFAFRVLTSTPGMAALAVVSLAVGIAAYTTIFSVIYTLLLAPPVYKDFDRLVVLWESNKSKDTPKAAVAPATFNDWREHSRAFQRLELVAPGSPVTVTSSGLPERANIQYATAGLFDLLGVQPLLGRTFASEKSPTANPVLLTYSFWQHRFGGDRQVVGQSMVVNGMTRTVTGILPQGFHLFNTDTDLWFPIEFPDLRSHDRMFRVWLIAVGKLKPSVKLTAAQAEMDVLSRQIARAHPDTNEGWGVKIDPLQEAQFGEWKPILYPLFGAVVFVLLISCANTANLLPGRFASRTHEMSVRASLAQAARDSFFSFSTKAFSLRSSDAVWGFY